MLILIYSGLQDLGPESISFHFAGSVAGGKGNCRNLKFSSSKPKRAFCLYIPNDSYLKSIFCPLMLNWRRINEGGRANLFFTLVGADWGIHQNEKETDNIIGDHSLAGCQRVLKAERNHLWWAASAAHCVHCVQHSSCFHSRHSDKKTRALETDMGSGDQNYHTQMEEAPQGTQNL